MSGAQWTTGGRLATLATLLEVLEVLDEQQAALMGDMLSHVAVAPELQEHQRAALKEWARFCRAPDEWTDLVIRRKAITALRQDIAAVRDAIARPRLFEPLKPLRWKSAAI